jgi:hypothetical protein
MNDIQAILLGSLIIVSAMTILGFITAFIGNKITDWYNRG